ncbi:MAG: NYN domain-containing protein [Acidimicrobiales bacterium]
MSSEHIVVDGSNIATEGRSAPSLAQLEEAVSELRREFPDAEITVIVDATFSHRIDPSELERFEQGVLEGDYVHPPAGAIGRGDAFLLRIAQKVDAIALSNDSFQEFHGEHPWLFERGRLLGATPVPGVGWIFTPRQPVRGLKSRKAVKDTDKERRKVTRAIEAATKEAVSPPSPVSQREPAARRRSRGAPVEPGDATPSESPRRTRQRTIPAASAVNDPLTFISFIAEHPLGAEVPGRVDSYTSHGAVVFVGSVQCYVPLANMGVPPPRSAREVLKRDEERPFVVTALDPLRRGVELALPGTAVVSGRPSEEMIAAELRLAKKAATPAKKARVTKKAAAPAKKATAPTKQAEVSKKAAAPAKKATAPTKKATAPTKQAEVSKKAAVPAKKVAAPAKKATAPTKQAEVSKKAAPAKKAAAPAKKATAPTKKATAPAKKAEVSKKAAAPAKKATAPAKKADEPRRSPRTRSNG